MNQTSHKLTPSLPLKGDIKKGAHSKSLSSVLNAPTIVIKKRSTENSAREKAKLVSAIDQVGKLTETKKTLESRLNETNAALEQLINDNRLEEIAGEHYSAKVKSVENKQLLPKTKIMTPLIALLQKANAQEKSKGGLFDMLLSLEPEILNTYFQPLLEELFKKHGLEEEAHKLFYTTASKKVVLSLKDAV
ncbi:hypothetical protein CWB96_00240 [Pseudoalteromonas citrea]|uniref:Uncharacterized protein n=1 Tax=Pseudoalteromonas citrea TaxID=43655 RepID=A0A5S3XXA6_9GAMM|nr:hypothetical protein [Pseudoalteromonas citrea]TMP46295.1 hypothetical protein CWB97_02235 [Pseudoalteromonas citrea]TMP63071.1 hypothetical protein CWB96_00240 [Pseudoalteromonas citrea]